VESKLESQVRHAAEQLKKAEQGLGSMMDKVGPFISPFSISLLTSSS
jgi:hypothetical protein